MQLRVTRFLDDGRKIVTPLDIPYGGQSEGVIDLPPGTGAGDFDIPFSGLDCQYLELQNDSDVEALLKLNGSASLYSLSPGGILVMASESLPEGTQLNGALLHTEATTAVVGGIKFRVLGTKIAVFPFIPTIYAGCTLDLRANVGFDEMVGWEDQSGLGHDFLIQRGVPTDTGLIGGRTALLFNGVDDELGSDVVGAVAPSSLISAGAFTCLSVVNVIDCATDSATAYNNPATIAAASGFWSGALFRSTGKAGVGNFDVDSDQANADYTLGTDAVICTWHTGGNIFVQVNGGAPASVASGNTGDLTGVVYLGKSQAFFLHAAIAQLACWNVSLAAPDRNAAIAAAMAFHGIV